MQKRACTVDHDQSLYHACIFGKDGLSATPIGDSVVPTRKDGRPSHATARAASLILVCKMTADGSTWTVERRALTLLREGRRSGCPKGGIRWSWCLVS